jgi:hypothetical protein
MFRSALRGFVVCSIVGIASVAYGQPIPAVPGVSVNQVGTLDQSAVRVKKDPASGNLYVLQINGAVRRVIRSSEGPAQFPIVYGISDHGVEEPLGMAFGTDGTMYIVGNGPDSTDQWGRSTIARGVPDAPGSGVRTWSVLATTVQYLYGHTYNHRMSGIAVDPSGEYIYVNSGSRTDHGEEREGHREVGLTAIILKLPADGENILLLDDREWLRDNGYIMAEGIRNTFDLAFTAGGNLFGVENAGDRSDPEELNWIREGHHYGFPWRIGGNETPQQFTPYDPMNDPLLHPNAWGGGNLYETFSNDPDYPPPPDGVTFTDPVPNYGPDADRFRDPETGEARNASEEGTAITTFTAHRSPNGIVFDADSLLPGGLKSGGFVISMANGSILQQMGDTGGDLKLLELIRENDEYAVSVTRIVSGFNSPLGLEISGDTLFVAETGLWFPPNNNPRMWEVVFTDGVTGVDEDAALPSGFSLGQNYPNPFNPSTTITFEMPVEGRVILEVFDILGRRVATLVDDMLLAGSYSAVFDAADLSSGVFFYRIRVSGEAAYTEAKPMLLSR